jgi:hypothetical protein
MTKKVTKKKVEEVEEANKPSQPHIAFTEAELRDVSDFINMVWSNAKFEGTMAQARDRDKLFTKMHQHHEKLKGYVLEILKVTNPKKDE